MSDDLPQRFAAALRSNDSPLRDQALAPLIRASPLLFAQLCLKGPNFAPFHGRLLFSEAHKEWESIYTKEKRYCIWASRGAGKTHCCTIIQALWRCATIPNGSAYIFSGTEFAAQRILDEIKREISNNPKLQWLYPTNKRGKWTATQLQTSNGHQIVAKGMMTRVRGAHPMFLWLDDALVDEDGWSQAKRQKTIDFFYSTLTNMMLPGSQIGVVGTPFHAQDLLSNLASNPAYKTYKYPALDKSGCSTWPEVFSTRHLNQIKAEIGSVRFARERLCEPVSDESSLFPRSLFFDGDMMMEQARLGAPADYWASLGITQFYVGCDFAFSTSVQADFNVFTVLGLDHRGNRWLVDMVRGRGMSFSEQKAQIVGLCRRYPPVIAHLEANQAQQIAADELRRLTDIPIRKFYTSSKKHKLDEGLPSLRILLENGKFRFPRGDARSVEMTDILINEATNFTWLKGKAKSVGGHDDCLLSLYLADRAIVRASRVVVADSQPVAVAGPFSRASALVQHAARQQADVTPQAQPRSIVPVAEPVQSSGAWEMRGGVPVRVG